MKKIKVEFEIEVSDDFQIGDCSKCPFQDWVYFESDEFTDCYDYCIIDGNCEYKLKEVMD